MRSKREFFDNYGVEEIYKDSIFIHNHVIPCI